MPIPPLTVRQAAVVPIRNGQVCLVGSRGGKRWVVPKGNAEPGKTSGEIALQEAWEEAGLAGLIQPEPLGSYTYTKDGATCWVVVYLMTVTEAHDVYPESNRRRRVWLPFLQAMASLDDPGLKEIVRAVAVARAG